MLKTRRNRLAGFIALATLTLPWHHVSAQEDAALEKDISVQVRGPIHEAYAQPAEKNPQPTPVVPKKPPPPIPEEPPAQKPQEDNVQWIPGYWAWDTDKQDFLWVSGFWRQPPPDRQWTPGHWTQADNGWQWVPGLWAAAAAQQQDFRFLPEPPASVDQGPSIPAPDNNSFYVPGCWQYRDTGYRWRPGFWSPGYNNWVWNSANYSWTPSGYLYNPGYWDYPLADRGLLFAPVYFNRPLWQRPGFFFTPRFVVNPFFSSVFLPRFSTSFFFGSSLASPFFFPSFFPSPFFFPGFAPSLFSSPFFFHHHHNFFSPTFARGGFPLVDPPLHGTAQIAPLWGISPVTPLSQFHSNKIRLTNVSPTQLAHERASIQRFRETSVQRTQVERPGATPRSLAPQRDFAHAQGTRPRPISESHAARLTSPSSAPRFERGGDHAWTSHFAGPGGAAPARFSAMPSSHRVSVPTVSGHHGGMPHVSPSLARPAPSFHAAGPSRGHGGGGHSGGGHGHGGGHHK